MWRLMLSILTQSFDRAARPRGEYTYQHRPDLASQIVERGREEQSDLMFRRPTIVVRRPHIRQCIYHGVGGDGKQLWPVLVPLGPRSDPMAERLRASGS